MNEVIQVPELSLNRERVKSEMTDKFIGPVLPSHLLKDEESDEGSVEEEDSTAGFGPALPPHLKAKTETASTKVEDSEDVDMNMIGPVLPGSSSSSVVQEALEERAEQLKYQFLLGKFDDSSEIPKRESWMTELPPEKAVHLGLGPRKFRKNYADNSKGSRSAWTETPGDSKKKNTDVTEDNETNADLFEAASLQRRNEIMDTVVAKSKKHKKGKESLSLLEIHQKKLKKKKKKSKKDEKKERRPFDREVDLQVNRFDEAQKKSIIKKAQLLDTRFGAGKSKYL